MLGILDSFDSKESSELFPLSACYLRKSEDIDEELVNQLTLPDKVGRTRLGGRGPPSRSKQGCVREAIELTESTECGGVSKHICKK